MAVKPAPGPSKSRVNKAGDGLARWWVFDAEPSEAELTEYAHALYVWRAQHAYPMALVMPSLRNWVDRYSSSGIKPTQRLKRTRAIIEKLLRHPGMKLARMQDIGGARAVLADRSEVEQIHARIKKNWKPSRTADYRDEPRATGYRALHLMVPKRDKYCGELRTVEVQLRTTTEHRWAEAVYAAGDRLGYALRDGIGPSELVEYFRVASDVLWLQDRGELADPALIERFADLREQVRPYFERTE